MPLEIPNLDDRRWADLVEDARALIPRFAPQWTDHNAHDPGITFIELFAWLVEMQMYQVNRVGERHREAFARLAGVRRRAETPARVDVRVDGSPASSIVVPAATQVAPVEAGDIVFETTERVQLTRSRLVRVLVDDGTSTVDQTEANAKAGIAFLAFGERARPNASLVLRFDRFHPDEEPVVRIGFDGFTDNLTAPCDPEASRRPDGDAPRTAAVELAWEYRDSSNQWRPLTVQSDTTYALLQSGIVTLVTPSTGTMTPVTLRARIVGGQYNIEPRLQRVGLNVLPCVQRETVSDERLGTGSGDPDQVFTLARGPVLSSSGIKVLVENVDWKAVESFDASGPTSQHYVFHADARTVAFGNGLNGRVPRASERIVASYSISLGTAGNVTRGLVWRFTTLVVPGVSLTNPGAGVGGTARQSTNELELEAQALVSRSNRGVTLRDLERLALATPHVRVARAKAIPNCPSPESITVVAVPKTRPGRPGPPAAPSPVFLAAVHAHLQELRMLCDDVLVVAPTYVEVGVSARLRLAKGAGAALAVDRARRALDQFLAGGHAGPSSPCPTRWPFGRSVFPSDVYAVLDSVAGVEFAADVVLQATQRGTPIVPNPSGAIPVPSTGLVFAGTHHLTTDAGSGGMR